MIADVAVTATDKIIGPGTRDATILQKQAAAHAMGRMFMDRINDIEIGRRKRGGRGMKVQDLD
jgi:hypothetical protein